MAILFKTYNGRNQLHVYGEHWKVKSSKELKEILVIIGEKNAKKAVIAPDENHILINLNELIIECKGASDLKKKFDILADYKIKYQNIS